MDNNFSKDMKMVAEVIGDDATRKLMSQLGGIYLYIPKASREDIVAMLKQNGYDAKEVASTFNVSLSRVYKILREVRIEERFTQHSIFEY